MSGWDRSRDSTVEPKETCQRICRGPNWSLFGFCLKLYFLSDNKEKSHVKFQLQYQFKSGFQPQFQSQFSLRYLSKCGKKIYFFFQVWNKLYIDTFLFLRQINIAVEIKECVFVWSGPLHWKYASTVVPCNYATPNYAIFAATLFWMGSKKTWVKLFSSFFPPVTLFSFPPVPLFSSFPPSYATSYVLEEKYSVTGGSKQR